MTSSFADQGTEAVDPRFADVERWPISQLVSQLLEDQIEGLRTAALQALAIAEAAEAMSSRLASGGRLVFAGAGTSGRIAVQDGVELQPTYGWPLERLSFIIAGGAQALTRSMEGAEDDEASARAMVDEERVTAEDCVICVAASGRTPFTVEVARQAGLRGALTIGVANNPEQPLTAVVQHPIEIVTGPEVIAGSTRMKAGTAQKAVLNALSTATMVRLGFVRGGLMTSMRISNRKLHERAIAIIGRAAGVSPEKAAAALEQTGNDLQAAIDLATSARSGAGPVS